MKKLAGFSMFVVVCLLFAFMVNVEVAISNTDMVTTATTATTTTEGDDVSGEVSGDEATQDDADKVVIPDSAAMTLGMQDSPNVMPENFRGGDPDSGLVHCLEDVVYQKHEHSLIYQPDSQELAEGTEFKTDPNITWTTSIKNGEDGEFEPMEEPRNTNMASDDGAFFTPGEYQIGNSGARQVGSVDGADDATTEMAKNEEPTNEVNTNEVVNNEVVNNEVDNNEVDNNEVVNNEVVENREPRTVTAQQSMGVRAHDCTPPDLWVAFKETTGSRQNVQTDEELLSNMKDKIVETRAAPLATEEIFSKNLNYIFVEEGKAEERDLEPWNKTIRVTVAGPMFNEDGLPLMNSVVAKTSLLSKEEQTRLAQVVADSTQDFKGIYVRRNVPFSFSAVATDNGDVRKTAGVSSYNVDVQIFDKNGKTVKKINDAYVFRKPNYPLNEYKEEEVFTFKATAKDLSGNLTEIFLPLYVVDTHASFESHGNK